MNAPHPLSPSKPSLLITGGAGYIASHTIVELLTHAQYQDYPIIALDNLCNSHPKVFDRIKEITGRAPSFIQGDLRDSKLLSEIFTSHSVSCVIHFAALKAVGDSVKEPLRYYENNVGGFLTLLETVKKHQVPQLIFSSSATVYGNQEKMPLTENSPTQITSPYGHTKLICENILHDFARAHTSKAYPFRYINLRYFNPIGAHPSGLIGESNKDQPNNIMPLLTQVAVKKRPFLSIFGNDYPTQDGTGVRDYIHVVDLALGHIAALDYLSRPIPVTSHQNQPGPTTINLGTGQGYSVLELIQAFEKATGVSIPHQIQARRNGDVATCFADASLAKKALNWKATRSLSQMCEDAWNWQKQNPEGFF